MTWRLPHTFRWAWPLNPEGTWWHTHTHTQTTKHTHTQTNTWTHTKVYTKRIKTGFTTSKIGQLGKDWNVYSRLLYTFWDYSPWFNMLTEQKLQCKKGSSFILQKKMPNYNTAHYTWLYFTRMRVEVTERGDGERDTHRGEESRLCTLDWSIPAFGGGGPYMHVNSCCILYWGCYLIPNEWAETDVALQIMLVLICMLPEECAHSGQEALTTVQLSPLSSAVHLKHLWKAACTYCRTLRKLSSTHSYRLTFSVMVPLSKIETMRYVSVK